MKKLLAVLLGVCVVTSAFAVNASAPANGSMMKPAATTSGTAKHKHHRKHHKDHKASKKAASAA